MIMDSYAHYNNNAYKKPFQYLAYEKTDILSKNATGNSASRNCRMPIINTQLSREGLFQKYALLVNDAGGKQIYENTMQAM